MAEDKEKRKRQTASRKRVEKDLEESRDLLRAVIEALPDIIFVKDLQGVTVLGNSALARFYNKSSLEEVIGKDDAALLPPDIARYLMDFDRRIMTSGKAETFEESVPSLGEPRTYLTTKAPYRDHQGNIIGLVGIARDITQLKRAEDELRAARELLEQRVEERTMELQREKERFLGIYNSSTDAIGYATLEGVLGGVNDAFCTLTGYSKEELVAGRKYQDLTPPEYHEYEAKIIEQIVRTGQPAEYEKEYIRKDGSRVPISLTTFVVRGAEGEPVGVAAIIKDITERKLAGQALLELSTPVLRLWEGILGLPLIGTIDTARAQQIMEKVLQSIVATESTVVIIDVTGIPVVDTKVAGHLLDTGRAANLLGAQYILTGISPSVAQTLTKLDVDLSQVITRGTLRGGLEEAFKIINVKVLKVEE